MLSDLVINSVNLEMANNHLITPLILSISKANPFYPVDNAQYVTIAELLLKHKAKTTVTYSNGSLLQLALKYNNWPMVKVLLPFLNYNKEDEELLNKKKITTQDPNEIEHLIKQYKITM